MKGIAICPAAPATHENGHLRVMQSRQTFENRLDLSHWAIELVARASSRASKQAPLRKAGYQDVPCPSVPAVFTCPTLAAALERN